MIAHTVPATVPRSSTFAVRLNGSPVEVYATGVADFLLVEGDESFALDIALPRPAAGKAIVKPLRLGIAPEVAGASVRCVFSAPVNASIEIEGFKPLFVFASRPETDRPAPDAPGVHYFGGGGVYETDLLRLGSHETLYIEGGTVLRACVVAEDAEDVRICGCGVLDGTRPAGAGVRPLVTFSHCRDCRIEDVTFVRPTNWMTLLGDCERVAIRNLHEIGEVVCSDGIDVVGSRDIEIDGCFLCNNDDCVVVKSMTKGYSGGSRATWGDNVHGIRVRGCSLHNLGAGNAMEIGFELRSDLVEDVLFEDIDVLAAHQNAAVFSIHNGDHALVRHIRYRDIRVEHYWNKLVDIRILRSRYTKDSEPGRVEDVAFEHIRCVPNIFNTPSLIGGFDSAHRVSGVVFDDFRLGDHAVRSADELELYTNCADGIEFR